MGSLVRALLLAVAVGPVRGRDGPGGDRDHAAGPQPARLRQTRGGRAIRGPRSNRSLLLPGGLEVDIAFTPVADFGPRGPDWRIVFGQSVERTPTAPPRRDQLVGLAWHHVLHARACLERRKPWQAEWLISGVRDQVVALACLRLGLTTRYAKAADELPPEVTAPLRAALVRSLEDAELRRALAAVAGALAELERCDPPLARRLGPTLTELATGDGLSRGSRSTRAFHA